jgi:hypothetical protein
MHILPKFLHRLHKSRLKIGRVQIFIILSKCIFSDNIGRETAEGRGHLEDISAAPILGV